MKRNSFVKILQFQQVKAEQFMKRTRELIPLTYVKKL